MNKLNLSTYKVSPLSLIFLIKGTQVLTLKRAANKSIYPGRLSGFGGKVEPGETMEAAVRREFLEETGLKLGMIELRGNFIRIMDNGYINEMYIYVASEYEGQLQVESTEGKAAWMEISDFLGNKDIVDHIPLYFKQIVAAEDFYCGIGVYENDRMISYTDNSLHFNERKAHLHGHI